MAMYIRAMGGWRIATSIGGLHGWNSVIERRSWARAQLLAQFLLSCGVHTANSTSYTSSQALTEVSSILCMPRCMVDILVYMQVFWLHSCLHPPVQYVVSDCCLFLQEPKTVIYVLLMIEWENLLLICCYVRTSSCVEMWIGLTICTCNCINCN